MEADSNFWSGGGGGEAPEALDFLLAIYFAFGFLGAGFVLDTLIFKRLAGILLKCGASKVIDEARWSKIVKCSESMWKLTYYVSTQLWVISIMQREPWALKTNEYFKGWPNQELTFSLKLFYMCQGGFYVYSIGALLTWETRRKDFSIMMSHHISTSILIGFSYMTRWVNPGESNSTDVFFVRWVNPEESNNTDGCYSIETCSPFAAQFLSSSKPLIHHSSDLSNK